MAAGDAFWLTNRVANPVLRRFLRSRPGRRMGRGLAVLRYTGRRTGQAHELVCQYARAGDTVWVLVATAEQKTWWRNLRGGAAAGLTAYLSAVPLAARALGLPKQPAASEVATAPARATLVRATLT